MIADSTSRAILQNLPHAVLLLDADLRVALANRAAALLLGAPMARLRGARISSLLPDGNLDLLLRDFGARRTKVMETSLASPAGAPALTLKITAVPLASRAVTPGGRAVGRGRGHENEYRLLLLEDISEVAALEQQLVETEKQLAMGQLAAGLLHEIGNPLASIGSNLLFIRESLGEATSRQVAQALDLSLEQIESARQLLGTLSGFRRRMAVRYEITDVQALLRRAVDFIARDAERRGIRIAASIATPLPPCEIDVRLMKQVLLNLFKNAVEAMPHGGRLEVRAFPGPADPAAPPTVVIEVEDSGVGIAESDLRRVFRPLFSTKPRGSGLGLSFCRQAVEEHGGHIRLASLGKDRGTVATLTLPISQSAAAVQ